MKPERTLTRIVLAPVFAATLFFGAAVMPGPAAAASGCHLETRNPTDQDGLVSTYYMVSFCTNPKTINYVGIVVTPHGQFGAVVWDLYVTNNTSACTRDTGYILRQPFGNWVIPAGSRGYYTWNIYSPVNFGSLTMVCLRYRYLDIPTYSTTFPFYGYV